MGGAHRAVGTSNDTLILNPAGMAFARRYSAALQYAFSPYDSLSRFNASVVDSKSGPVAGGVSYTFDRSTKDPHDAGLHRLTIGSAYALSDNVAFGMTGRHIRGNFSPKGIKKDVTLFTGDIGLAARLGSYFSLGITYHNFLRTKAPRLTPPALAGGLAFNSGSFVLASDVRMDISHPDHKRYSYHAGAEYFLGGRFPVRAGYQNTPYVTKAGNAAADNIISAGLGWVDTAGSLDVSYEHSFSQANHWGFIAALTFYM
jgi:hypothetical protein